MSVGRAERLAARLPAPVVAALRIADTVAFGAHGLRRAGPGYAFWQYRPYALGDPARSVDWRRSAREDRILVREREREAAQTVWFWEDRSASMDYSGAAGRETKAERARLLVLAAAVLLMRADEQIAPIGPSPIRYRHERQLTAVDLALDRAPPVDRLPPDLALGRHAQAVLVGDFLDDERELAPLFRRLDHERARVHLVQVLDPAERDLPMRGRCRFEGMEGEGSLLVQRVGGIRTAYRERLRAHNAGLERRAARPGWTLIRHWTDSSPAAVLSALTKQLAERPSDGC